MNPEQVITRFPPSPTGFLHIGGVRTALFNYLFAKHVGGRMFLRFEDTDRERSKPEFEQDILNAMKWLNLPYELPSIPRQSERTAVYSKYFEKLIDRGLAYEAEENKDDPTKKVVRFKNPNTTITFTDLIRGEVSFNTSELGDFVIAKSVIEPLYHLAVVIDDYEMEVTHVIRGEDHISNTPRQILILEALGFTRPHYAHLPLILASDRTKFSKRHGAVSVNEYKALGFLPEAMLNYLALLGWNPGGEREVFTLDELVGAFSIEHVHKAGAIFDVEKLKWFNHEHLKKLSNEEFSRRLQVFRNGEHVDEKIVPLIRERSQTLKDAADAIEGGEYDFIHASIAFEPVLLLKGAKTDAAGAKVQLQKIVHLLKPLATEGFTAEKVKEVIFPYATEVGRATVLWPMRVALSGKEKSPDPFTLSGLLGKERTLLRIEQAIQML